MMIPTHFVDVSLCHISCNGSANSMQTFREISINPGSPVFAEFFSKSLCYREGQLVVKPLEDQVK